MDGTVPKILKISVSASKGEKKKNVESANIIEKLGIEGDAHFGSERPISLLSYESFAELKGLPELKPGDFAENITTLGLDYNRVKAGTRIALGDDVVIEVIQIGKECHNGCVIKQTVGDCIMPRRGVFARPIRGGRLSEGDHIEIL